MSASSPRQKRERPESTEPAPEHARAWERAAERHAFEAGVAAAPRRAARVRQGRAGEAAGESKRRRAGRSCARVGGEKPLPYIIQNLERAYGVPVNKWTAWDPLDLLVATILSQATSDANSERTYAALKRRFPVWEAALGARAATLAATIREGGLANQKARVIRDLLRQVKERTGALTLEHLRELPLEEAARFLSSFRGVGPKTVACTLLFACQMETFPLDTHIFRILRRAGLIPEKCSDARAHEIMTRLVPEGKFYSLHVNLIRHGRKLCRPRAPLCDECPIVEYCDYGQTVV